MNVLRKIKVDKNNKKELETLTSGLSEFLDNFSLNFKGKMGVRLENLYPRDTIVFFPLNEKSEIKFFGASNYSKIKLNTKIESFPEGYLIIPSPDSSVYSDILNYRIECAYKALPKSA